MRRFGSPGTDASWSDARCRTGYCESRSAGSTPIRPALRREPCLGGLVGRKHPEEPVPETDPRDMTSRPLLIDPVAILLLYCK